MKNKESSAFGLELTEMCQIKIDYFKQVCMEYLNAGQVSKGNQLIDALSHNKAITYGHFIIQSIIYLNDVNAVYRLS